MTDHYLYLVIDLCCVIIPFLAGFHSKIPFNREWRSILPTIIITAALFIAWDMYFTSLNVWHFNPKYLTGIYCFNLPLEEVAFFLCIPYSCLFVYYCLDLYTTRRTVVAVNWFAMAMSLILATIAFINMRLLYTSSTFFLLAALLVILVVTARDITMTFFISFVISLLPFFISNGILTGSWIEEPVVLYNNRYNLHIRLMTIPLEDVFYGMAFQLMNVLLYCLFQNRNVARRNNK